MDLYVVDFKDIDKDSVSVVGGKGANLAQLAGIAGIRVPEGFCVTTDAFRRMMVEAPAISALLDELSLLNAGDQERIGAISHEIRSVLEATPVPQEIQNEVAGMLARFGTNGAYAVRSSATAEDLPGASFAGQQDSYLNVIGVDAILQHIRKCWASLFTERAVVYRTQNGFDHRKVYLAVVVQKMVLPEASGILFTADPVTSNRKVISIDAGLGLGEALVSGLVNPDIYKVRDGAVTEIQVSTQKTAIRALPDGHTAEQETDPADWNRQVLTDDQILQLAHIGRQIEAHFGQPQDIEWCLADGLFYIVQSRPITTLFPIPESNDAENRVYVSVGHQQMMTDAMKPLGLSFFLHLTRAPMRKAGGRLFVDITQMLITPGGRRALMNTLGKSEPLTKDALLNIIGRPDFVKMQPDDEESGPTNPAATPVDFESQFEHTPDIAAGFIAQSEASIKALRENIGSRSGPALFEFILEDIQKLKSELFDQRKLGVIIEAMNAAAWLNEKMAEWLGEKNVADTLSQSVPNNITSEMGLALLDVADVVRPYQEVVDYLTQVENEHFLEGLGTLAGGMEARRAIEAYLEEYGMRCAGEIDITKPRWIEKPATLVPLIVSNVKNFEPGAGTRRFEQGEREALAKEKEILERLQQMPDAEEKVRNTRRAIALIRHFAGYREYPKYSIVSHYLAYKQALLKEAQRLADARVIRDAEDIYYLTFEELQEVANTQQADYPLINARKEAHKAYERLTPPRVITSDGEIITGAYRREDLPAGAIAGLAVSSGIVEGRARVILNMKDARLEDGDILVTTFTDPSWTPLFVSIKGLVTEVGGLMTHGAVIAREYGLPAVVAVENATRLIQDGQRIRVNGTDGYVEVLGG